ncbi:unnamed protein product [Brassicogethes aeneus]|uniref:Uncharacterized protein n=1 Tax=Brassicogethes aeneus TaxID=1431903 RepID=A0A9P0BJY8_BRAAE|nr:unnamed protein product [Brassicogethes aeneus]
MEFCRLCLQNISKIIDVKNDKHLLLKIKECVTIDLSDSIDVNSGVCVKCIEKINDFYEFRTTCILLNVDNKYIQIDKAVKEEIIKIEAKDTYDCVLCSEEFNELTELFDHQKSHEKKPVLKCIQNDCFEVNTGSQSLEVAIISHEADRESSSSTSVITRNSPLTPEQDPQQQRTARRKKDSATLQREYRQRLTSEEAKKRKISAAAYMRDYRKRQKNASLVNEQPVKKVRLSAESIERLNHKRALGARRSRDYRIRQRNERAAAVAAAIQSTSDDDQSQDQECWMLGCSVCSKLFINQELLEDHQKSHDEEHIFKCIEKDCLEVFTTRLDLVKHESLHWIACDICEKMYDKSFIAKHIESHFEHPRCSVCSKPFINQALLAVHLKSHGDDKPYKCEICEYSGKTSGALSAHKKMRHQALTCEICHKIFNSCRYLNDHLRKTHAENMLKCQH